MRGMNLPPPPKDVLLESERKDLFGRITVYVGNLFRQMTTKADPKWSGSEIARQCGIQRSNVTMFQNYKKYNREISPAELENLLMGGIVTIKELKDKAAKSDKERAYLDEKFKLIRLKQLAEKHNINAEDVLEEHLKSQGIDVTQE
jgi:hypothetical protein